MDCGCATLPYREYFEDFGYYFGIDMSARLIAHN